MMNKKVCNIEILCMTLSVCIMLFCFSISVHAAAPPMRQTNGGEDWIVVSGYATNDYYGYVFQVSVNSGKTWDYLTKTTSRTSQMLTGFEEGKNYWLRIGGCRTLKNYIDGEVEGWSGAYIVATMPNASEKMEQTAATTNSISVCWEKANGATSYEIFYKEAGSSQYVKAGETDKNEMTIGALRSGTTYHIRVVSVKANDTFSIANRKSTKSIRTYTLLAHKSHVSLSGWNVFNNTIRLSWEAGVEKNQIGYQVEISDLKNKKVIIKDSTGQYEYYPHDGFSSVYYTFKSSKIKNKGFYVRVRPRYQFGDNVVYGVWSNYTKIIPVADVKVEILKKSKRVKLTWKRVENAKSYIVYKQTSDGKLKKLKTTKKTSYIDKNLKNNVYTHYYIVVNTKYGKSTKGAVYTTYRTRWVYKAGRKFSKGVGWVW